MRDHISRRGFLSTGLAAAVGVRLTLGAEIGDDPQRAVDPLDTIPRRGTVDPGLLRDPRLTARPVRPYVPVERGETRFGDELDRGGMLYVPEAWDGESPVPLVVALHGSGGSAARWSSLFEECEARGLVLLAPDSRAGTWDRVSGVFGPDVAFIDSALRFTFERCAIDPAKIALAGFSDGASYALSLGPSNGDLFTHLIAWSPGFSDPQEPIVGAPPVFVSHGSEDDVLPVVGTRGGIVPMFEMDGYPVRYLEFEGRHEMPPQVVEAALDWFLEDAA